MNVKSSLVAEKLSLNVLFVVRIVLTLARFTAAVYAAAAGFSTGNDMSLGKTGGGKWDEQWSNDETINATVRIGIQRCKKNYYSGLYSRTEYKRQGWRGTAGVARGRCRRLRDWLGPGSVAH